MGLLENQITLIDAISAPINNIMNAVNSTVNVFRQAQGALDNAFDPAEIRSAQRAINAANDALERFRQTGQNTQFSWQSDSGIEVLQTSGIERYRQELAGANSLIGQLAAAQKQLTQNAVYGNILPPSAANDMMTLNQQIEQIRQRITQISAQPMDVVSSAESRELEQLRMQLNSAVQLQNQMNAAVENMDIEGANSAYLQLSQTVGNTERYIRDNINEQNRFNNAIQSGVNSAGNLNSMISRAVGAFAGVAGIRKAIGFVEDCTQAFNTQLNAETQLIGVLANTLDKDYVARFELETTANTMGAINQINAIQNSIDEVTVPVSAELEALNAAFDRITEKAAEIQGRGIYGDETMIAAAAEFSTYFSDTDAIEMMMDTLADYAIGMSGGGEIGTQEMVNYATNLGKIMSGAYDAMTKKGFQLNETQKAIIEGEASREQIVSALGEEYADMTRDMQAAAAISQVIEESWAGLYENMSNTPQGKIIQLNNAWGDMKEEIGGRLYPAIISIVDVITGNWSSIQKIVNSITLALEKTISILSWIIESAIWIAEIFIDNWGWIEPLIGGITVALIAYNVALGVYNTVCGIASAVCKIFAASLSMQSGETFAATAAQYGFNYALLACPITWVIAGVVALIVALAIYTNCVNDAYNISLSFGGMLGGSIMTILTALGNTVIAIYNIVVEVIIGIWNSIADFANFFANVFNDPLGAVVRLFMGVFDSILQMIEIAVGAIGNLLGQDWSSGIQDFRDKMNTAVEQQFGTGVEIVPKIDEKAWSLDYINYDDAFDVGYYIGDELGKKFSGADYTNEINNALNFNYPFESIDKISGNTDDIANTLEMTGEELKYLRDLAEQEVVNRFTTAEISVSLGGITNNVSSNVDLDGIVDYIETGMFEAAERVAEGVH